MAISESAFAVVDRVPRMIDTRLLSDNSTMMIDHPAQVTVTVDDLALPLPPTRFVAIGQVAGVVTEVGLAPMLQFADLATCRALVLRLIVHAAANGWTVAERDALDLATMTQDLASTSRPRFNKTAALLRRGETDLRIYIKEATGGELEGRNPPARGNLFLVNTDFRDQELDDRQNERMFARRREVTGGVDNLPLDAWRPAAR